MIRAVIIWEGSFFKGDGIIPFVVIDGSGKKFGVALRAAVFITQNLR